MNNQKAKADAGKPRLTLVPSQIIWDVAEVREYGNRKYGSPDNWKQVELQRYRDALYRHMLEYVEDPDSIDEESKIPHYKHMACNMAFICAMEAQRHRNGDCVLYVNLDNEDLQKAMQAMKECGTGRIYTSNEIPEPKIECAWDTCEGCYYGWSDETGDCGCKLNREPFWDDDNECWTCEHYKDEMDLILSARARKYDEQEERGKDRAKGIHD